MKLAWSIAKFAESRLRKNGGNHDQATRAWVDDLRWLKTEFYEGYFSFRWPLVP